jgi:glycosyltransferase involved in cell wall biosynthesis
VRIVLVTPYYPAHRGGVERVAEELARRLVRAGGVQVEWHASDCDPAPSARDGLRCVPGRSWNAIERRLGFPYPLWTPSSLRRLVRAVRDAEVVHLHDCLYLSNLVAFVAARLARRPVLVTQHVGFVPYRNPVLRVLLRSANRLLGSFVLGNASRVVFESDAVRRYFERFVGFGRTPLLVPNGVDTATFAPVPRQVRESLRVRLGARDGQPLILFVGRFVEKKGLAVLRGVAGDTVRAHWIFAGWGALDPAGWGLSNVTVVRSPQPEDLVPLYQAADLLVLPSVGEGFPLVIQEAMACGTPALVGEETAAGCPEAGELLLREPVGAPDTAARWTERIESLLASPSSLQALRPKVAALARECWSWDRCAGRYAEILRDCVSAP